MTNLGIAEEAFISGIGFDSWTPRFSQLRSGDVLDEGGDFENVVQSYGCLVFYSISRDHCQVSTNSLNLNLQQYPLNMLTVLLMHCISQIQFRYLTMLPLYHIISPLLLARPQAPVYQADISDKIRCCD